MENPKEHIGETGMYKITAGRTWARVPVKVLDHKKGTGGHNWKVDPVGDAELSQDWVRSVDF